MTERMSQDAIIATAQYYHQMMVEAIQHPGDIIAVQALMMTNMLGIDIATGTLPENADKLLDAIKIDARVLAHSLTAQPAEATVQ